MRKEKLVIACILALVIISAFVQCTPEVLQDSKNLSTLPSEGISAFSEPQFDSEPCGGGGGDDIGGPGPR